MPSSAQALPEHQLKHCLSFFLSPKRPNYTCYLLELVRGYR